LIATLLLRGGLAASIGETNGAETDTRTARASATFFIGDLLRPISPVALAVTPGVKEVVQKDDLNVRR
jgi:hypothetical protein